MRGRTNKQRKSTSMASNGFMNTTFTLGLISVHKKCLITQLISVPCVHYESPHTTQLTRNPGHCTKKTYIHTFIECVRLDQSLILSNIFNNWSNGAHLVNTWMCVLLTPGVPFSLTRYRRIAICYSSKEIKLHSY